MGWPRADELILVHSKLAVLAKWPVMGNANRKHYFYIHYQFKFQKYEMCAIIIHLHIKGECVIKHESRKRIKVQKWRKCK